MKNLLIIEDDILTQKTLRIVLGKIYNVDICESAKEFYDNYSSNAYDIIIMDISLPGGKDGLQLTREIKKMDHFKNTSILCLTAHAFRKDRAMAEGAGVDYYIAKPVSNSVLREVIEKLIESKK